MPFLAKGSTDLLLDRRRHLLELSSCRVRDHFTHVMFAQQRTVEPVADNRNYDAAEAGKKCVRAAQRMAAKPVGAGPFDALPLQQIVRLQMKKFIEGRVRRGLEQSAGIKTKDIGRNRFAGEFGQKQTPVFRKPVGAFKFLESVARSNDIFAAGFAPGQIYVIRAQKIFSFRNQTHGDSMLFGKADIAAAVFGELLENRFRTLRKIEHDIALQLPAPKAFCRKGWKLQRRPG